MRKYEFTGETMEFEGRILRRIRYLEKKEPFIGKDMLGGWIEGEHNLSHEGACCINGNAKVFDNARVIDSVIVVDNAIVKDNALLKDCSCVAGDAVVGADSIIGDVSVVEGESQVFFYAQALDGNNDKMEESNLTGKTIIDGQTVIEATGTIYHSRIINQELTGNLNMENVILVKSVSNMNEYEPIMYGESES